MTDEPRMYSNEEFALILRSAQRLSQRTDSPSDAEGLSLAEMQAAAAQVGVDPALVERAARLHAIGRSDASVERIIGGPLRHTVDVHQATMLTETHASQLLSAVRVRGTVAGSKDTGHAGPAGMTWHDGGDLETLSVNARPTATGTVVSVTLDRRGTFAILALVTGFTGFMASLFAIFALYPESPALGIGGLLAGVGGVLGGARYVWESSSRAARRRVMDMLDAIDGSLTE